MIRDFQCIGTGVEKSRTHRIKTHLERQTHWLLGLLIHFKQCLFAIKIYFLVKEIKLYMPEHLHRSQAILKDIGWKSLDIPPRVLCVTTTFASAPSPPISLTLYLSQKRFILQPRPVSLKREHPSRPAKPWVFLLYFLYPSLFWFYSRISSHLI